MEAVEVASHHLLTCVLTQGRGEVGASSQTGVEGVHLLSQFHILVSHFSLFRDDRNSSSLYITEHLCKTNCS